MWGYVDTRVEGCLHWQHFVCQGWEYSAAMFIALNTAALVFISCAYWRMHRAVRASGLSLRSTQDRHDQALAQRFFVIVATDCMCWIPVIGVKLAALAGTCAHFRVSRVHYSCVPRRIQNVCNNQHCLLKTASRIMQCFCMVKRQMS
jgi:hypothetical protein